MTTQEITQYLDIPNSTLSDWEHNVKRERLVKLLRALGSDEVITILNAKNSKPKYSENTRKMTLNKKLFTKDLLWSRQDGSSIEIKNLISVYLQTPNQEDTERLVELFGSKRVISTLEKTRSLMLQEDATEAHEQIEYATEPETYFAKYRLPSLEHILKRPRKRYIDALMETYKPAELIDLAKGYGATFPTLFQIKKMTGISA